MALTKLDEKVLNELGLQELPEAAKEKTLRILDERLEKRFLANLLVSLPADKRETLEKEVEKMTEPDAAKIFEIAIKIHPNAQDVLIESAKQIINETKEDAKQIEKRNQAGVEAKEESKEEENNFIPPKPHRPIKSETKPSEEEFMPPAPPKIKPTEALKPEEIPSPPAAPSPVPPSEPVFPPPSSPAASAGEPPAPPTPPAPADDPPSDLKPAEKTKPETLTDGLWRSNTHPTSTTQPQPPATPQKEDKTNPKPPKPNKPADYYQP